MSHLLLHEEGIEAIFEQVGDIGVTKAVRTEPRSQPDRGCQLAEGGIEAVLAHPGPPLGGP